jgi:hypothetical protein
MLSVVHDEIQVLVVVILWEFKSPRPHQEPPDILGVFAFLGLLFFLDPGLGNCLGNSWVTLKAGFWAS